MGALPKLGVLTEFGPREVTASRSLRSLPALGGMLLTIASVSCNGDVIIDDYKDSAAVIQGVVRERGGPPIPGALVEFSADTPQYLQGDIVTADTVGAFRARVTSFGVGTFTASVRMQVRPAAAAPVALDTLLTGIRVVELRNSAQPDTVNLTIELAIP